MQLVDTHCHIHSADYLLSIDEVEANAQAAGVTRLICVGTDAEDSRRAVEFVQGRPNHWASIGVHPHEAKEGEGALRVLGSLLNTEASARSSHRAFPPAPSAHNGSALQSHGEREASGKSTMRALPGVADPERLHSSEATDIGRDHSQGISEAQFVLSSNTNENRNSEEIGHSYVSGIQDRTQKIVAIGECGLDYFYNHSPKEDQARALRYQIELALQHNLPLIFHVREAFDDFWPIFDSYQGLRGVLHSFTDTQQNLEKALERNLFLGINGIMTFTKNNWQLELVKKLPLKYMTLETDAPFLTPVPNRGKINEPANVLAVANFLGKLRNDSPENIAAATTRNARHLFSI